MGSVRVKVLSGMQFRLKSGVLLKSFNFPLINFTPDLGPNSFDHCRIFKGFFDLKIYFIS